VLDAFLDDELVDTAGPLRSSDRDPLLVDRLPPAPGRQLSGEWIVSPSRCFS
jgi:hypothetical protein